VDELHWQLTLIAKQLFQVSAVTSPVCAWYSQCSTQAKAHYSHTENVYHSCAVGENIQRTSVLEHLADGIVDVGFGRDVALHAEFGGIFGGPLLWRCRNRRLSLSARGTV